MSHLGDRAAALVDGELDHDSRDLLLAHVALCPPCRHEVEAERAVRARLASLSTPPLPDAVTRRLLALAEPGEPLPPRVAPMSGTWRPPSVPVARRPPRGPAGPRRHGSRRRAGHPVGVVAGAMSFASVTLAAAFALGGPVEQRGVPVSPVDRFSTDRAGVGGETSADTAGSGLPGVPEQGSVSGVADLGFGLPTIPVVPSPWPSADTPAAEPDAQPSSFWARMR